MKHEEDLIVTDNRSDVNEHEEKSENISAFNSNEPITVKQVRNGEVGEKSRRLNVLFLMADDMRPLLGSYLGGDFPNLSHQSRLLTPNFDKLARESIVFKNAYVQYSLCGPSRTSILTGRRPDTTRIFGNVHYWRTAGGNFTTLPQYTSRTAATFVPRLVRFSTRQS
jgi:hypothetical protein